MTDLCCFSFKRKQSTYISYFLKLKTIVNNVTYFSYIYIHVWKTKCAPYCTPYQIRQWPRWLTIFPTCKLQFIISIVKCFQAQKCNWIILKLSIKKLELNNFFFGGGGVVISFRVLSGFRSILENRRIHFCISLPVLLHSRNSRGWEQSFCLKKNIEGSI